MNRKIKVVGTVILLFLLFGVSLTLTITLVLENSIVFANGDSDLSKIL